VAQEPDDRIRHTLAEGDRRSRAAVTRPSGEPVHVVLWRRHKWKILALLFLLLTELCLLFLGKGLVMGPG
jgi:hypothetical protein